MVAKEKFKEVPPEKVEEVLAKHDYDLDNSLSELMTLSEAVKV